ncbi:hypothetical protein [Stenoxybacter acetivorans]|uniref:hypothetical protein n=1 Tax=Stenoxybacter acetivorans TaxID=422441 RepID=UPI0012EC7FE5|nr:hypothetical protein [Stenoxybacter acetivorans]
MKESLFSRIKLFIAKHKILPWCLALSVYGFLILATSLSKFLPLKPIPILHPNKSSSIAPKDPYGRDYLIGNLGGRPVRVLASVSSSLMEYEDSPFFDLDKKKRIKLSERTYDSAISGFNFYLRYTDGVYYDLLNREISCQFKKEHNQPGNAWMMVSISNATGYYDPPHVLDRYLDGNLENYPGKPKEFPYITYEKMLNKQFGLDVYIVPGIDPKTNLPYRKDRSIDDVFVHRNTHGNIDTYIKCFNGNVLRPPCGHDFMILQEDMKLKVSLSYNRQILPYWQEIQATAKEAVLRFDIKNPIHAVWAQQQNIPKICTQQ